MIFGTMTVLSAERVCDTGFLPVRSLMAWPMMITVSAPAPACRHLTHCCQPSMTEHLGLFTGVTCGSSPWQTLVPSGGEIPVWGPSLFLGLRFVFPAGKGLSLPSTLPASFTTELQEREKA